MTPAQPPPTPTDPGPLIALLQQAAHLEHCLLLTYLYTGFSMKSTPQELAYLEDGTPNVRRGYQFERIRSWKRTLLSIASEEMFHLHYVQCLLRALGASPCFALPERDPEGNWYIDDWIYDAFGGNKGQQGTPIAMGRASLELVCRFFGYEASDVLQSQNLFGPDVTSLLHRLYNFERELYLESIVFDLTDAAAREALKDKLRPLYFPEPPGPPPVEDPKILFPPSKLAPTQPPGRFFSIGDLYRYQILPLYNDAFEKGWVKHSNRKLNNETLAPGGIRQQKLVPVGPLQRSSRFARFVQKATTDPLRDFKTVENVVEVIVDEGEGFFNFIPRAKNLLAQVEKPGGARAYLEALQQSRSAPPQPPGPLDDGLLVRQSHLYCFAMIMLDLEHEIKQSGGEFQPARAQVRIESAPALQSLAAELPGQFNVCYLVLTSWLSRIYEIALWEKDSPRRQAIEMLASWPMMSTAIRPFLELLSFFPINPAELFSNSLPPGAGHVHRLKSLYESPERSEAKNAEMDHLALRALADVARWSGERYEELKNVDFDATAKAMILRRLKVLTMLEEYQRQFPFRVAGGYSDRLPDARYQQAHPDASRYEENPVTPDPLYRDTLVLRLRFSGWALAQLATDPDPQSDEVGCTGTIMFRAADGDRHLNRAIVWQPLDDSVILREPRDKLPSVGVRCVEAALLVANGDASATLVPVSSKAPQQSGAASQSAPVQTEVHVQGLAELASFGAHDLSPDGGTIQFNLTEKDGAKPIYIGLNHVIWQDGEPIDPFILSVTEGTDGPVLFQREVFNEDRSIVEMSPLQRLQTSRGPKGFDTDLSHIPDWAMSAGDHEKVLNSAYPRSFLAERAAVLTAALNERLSQGLATQPDVDAVVSFAERLLKASVPGVAILGWLSAIYHYGHTLSGRIGRMERDNPVMTAIARNTNLRLEPATGADRNVPNTRWLITYTLGLMDTDSLGHLVYGELYIPVNFCDDGQPVRLKRDWTISGAPAAVAQYACRFDAPFWAEYQIDGDTRSLSVPSGVVMETLRLPATADSYSYDIAGLPGGGAGNGAIAVSAGATASEARLTWEVSVTAPAAGLIATLGFIAAAAGEMKAALQRQFPGVLQVV